MDKRLLKHVAAEEHYCAIQSQLKEHNPIIDYTSTSEFIGIFEFISAECYFLTIDLTAWRAPHQSPMWRLTTVFDRQHGHQWPLQSHSFSIGQWGWWLYQNFLSTLWRFQRQITSEYHVWLTPGPLHRFLSWQKNLEQLVPKWLTAMKPTQ